MQLEKYKTFFFDFDGVLVDSNFIKSKNIEKATRKFVEDEEQLNSFVNFFTQNNGIPREDKVFKYFEVEKGEKILSEYYNLNQDSFSTMKVNHYFPDLLDYLHSLKAECYILSGGSKAEINDILKINKVKSLSGILTGPKHKTENLQNLDFPKPAIFIGDSKHDYEVAKENSLDFIFMHKYTQFVEWESFFSNIEIKKIIKDLNELL